MVALLLIGLLTAAPATDGLSLTFALQRPLQTPDEETFFYRLPQWEAAFPFDRYGFPVAPPTAGGDLAAQVDQLARLSGAIQPERLVVITPPVGTAGWEASNNLGYLPIGGRPTLVATERDPWLQALAAAPVGTVALILDGLAREPTAEEFGEYLDALLAVTEAKGLRAELWVPAGLLGGEEDPFSAALTSERLEQLRLVWLDLPQTVQLRQAEEARAAAASEGDKKNEAQPVIPTELQLANGIAALLAELAGETPAARGVGLLDGRGNPLQGLAPLREYLEQIRATGYGHVVIRGRLDTPQNEVWETLFRELGAEGEPESAPPD